MTALLLSFILVVYPNVLAFIVQKRTWDQWHVFTIGNAILTLGLFGYSATQGLLPSIWGGVTFNSALIGVATGCIPLVIILIALALPGRLSHDIVAAGIGHISVRRFMYRVGVQVALTTVVCEEFLFRGVLYVLLMSQFSPLQALCIGAMNFGMWHLILQYNGITGTTRIVRVGGAIGGVIVYCILGLLFVFVRQRTGSLLSVIIAHGVLDVGMFLGMLLRRSVKSTGV